MARLAELETRIASMGGLLEVVGAMRSLAGMRLQETQQLLPAARRYAGDISAAIGRALLMMPEPPAGARGTAVRRGFVLYAAEHGFVGALTERSLAAAREALSPNDRLFLLGSRAAAIATAHTLPVTWTAPMATRPASVPQSVRLLADELYRWIARGELTGIELIYATRGPGGSAALQRRIVIPLDLGALAIRRTEPAPLGNLSAPVLLEQLTAEYVFALLAEAALEAIASENGARFAAMTAAHDNVSKKLDALRATARTLRQSEITTELLDVVTGAQALEPKRR